jgi:hypothetical protein
MASRTDETPDAQTAQGTMAVALLQNAAALPEELEGVVDLSGWAEALVNKRPYREPNPSYLSDLLIRQTLEATSPEMVFTPNDLDGLQKRVPDVPNASTGPIEISGLYVASSNMAEGQPTYMILDITDMETGATYKTTTGASQLQAQILRLVSFGTWPIRCQIKRTERKDRGGRFLFWLFPPD